MNADQGLQFSISISAWTARAAGATMCSLSNYRERIIALQQQPDSKVEAPAESSVRLPGEPSSPITDIDQSFTAAMYTRLAAAVRLVACFAAVHVAFFFDPARMGLQTAALSLLILLFSIYAAWLYWRTVRDKTYRERKFVYWIDAVWYLSITALTGGPSSHFFFFLSFPLLFVSLRWGFRSGMVMTVFASSVLWASGIQKSSVGAALLNADVFLPPVGLLVLGYLMATWANSDLTLNRRLSALKEFNALFSPRYSIEQMMDRVARHLARLHRVEKFALVLQESGHLIKVFRADLPDPMYQVSDAAALEIAGAMSRLHDDGTMVYSGKRGLLPAEIHCSNPNADRQKGRLAEARAIANRLDCISFCSVQFDLREQGRGRLFVWSDGHYFGSADLPFFHQLGEQMAPRIENVQLLDRLANQVAEAERQKISRDIHDSAIQPYIGLKFGLEALARKIPAGNPLSKDIGRLVEMATTEITELRTFVKGLRGDEDPGRAALVPALQRQAARFCELYGIAVVVESPSELRIGDALANEAFHMVSEALSNIRRHTTASHARIKVSADEQTFKLQVINPCEGGADAKLFTPRSIAERARALGGECHVATRAGGATEVIVEIPLHNRPETA
jgi:signal transduction histidine kinase